MENKDIRVLGQMDNTMDNTFESSNRVYDTEGVAPTIPTCVVGNLQPKIMECHVVGGIGEMKSNSGTQYFQQDRVYSEGDVAPCMQANLPGGSYKFLLKGSDGSEYEYAIRKLTPRECWRLMDFTDEQFDRANEVCSATQLYKQAGNSIVVSCLEAIFSQMGIGEKWNDRKFEEGTE